MGLVQKSNITIAPNIYVRTAQTLQTDDAFIKSVYGHKALNILKSRFPKSYTERFTRTQVEEMKQNVICRAGKTREHAYGKALINDKIVWSCRCENVGCYAYERCMSLPNALRINRAEIVELEVAEDTTDEYGFDYEGCSFEAPISVFDVTVMEEDLTASQKPAYNVAPFTAENPVFIPGVKTLVVCSNAQEAGYFSTVLYQKKIKYRPLRSEGYTLNRRIADIFWDYCGEEIGEEAFLDRYFVRVGGTDAEGAEFYRALRETLGDTTEDFLKVGLLADALNGAGRVGERLLNMEDDTCAVTVAIQGDGEIDYKNYDEVFRLKSERDIYNIGDVIEKEAPEVWSFTKGANGRNYRVSPDNYKGERVRCLNVEVGLWGDLDGRSFLEDETGDSLRTQVYISEKVKEGDELTVEKNTATGGYSLYHSGVVVGSFPDSVIREIKETEGFPEDFVSLEGIYVKNIVTCAGEKGDMALPARFRDARIWLGLEIAGFAKIKI